MSEQERTDEFVAPERHGPMIAAFTYRGVMVCRRCVTPEEHRMTGQFHDWHGVAGSGWECDRCGTELEHQALDAPAAAHLGFEVPS